MTSEISFIFPSDPVFPRRADPQYEDERVLAKLAGFDTHLVDHDAMTRGELDLSRLDLGGKQVVYRGWMVKPEEYKNLAEAIPLFTSFENYRKAVGLPGWYSAFLEHTPESFWGSVESFPKLAGSLAIGPAIVKDYVKTMKWYWDTACFIPEISDLENAQRIVDRFVELREDELVGGIVLREFEILVGDEVRSWWVNGKHVVSTAHPDTPDTEIDPLFENLDQIAVAVQKLGAPFVTVDLKLNENEEIRVIEVGDGQVSEFPANEDSFSKLLEAFKS